MSSRINPTEPAEGYPSTLVHDEIGELQETHAAEFIALTEAIHTETQRRILYGLVDCLGDASYVELDKYTTVSRRSLRKHLSRLEEKDIVDRRDANFGLVAFSSHEVKALTQHLLYCYEEKHY